MILIQRLPDFRSRTPELAEFLAHYRRDDIILHGTTRYASYDRRPGPLSLKFAWGGEIRHTDERRRFTVHDGRYLVLNDGTCYATRISSPRPVEALTVYFGRRTMAQVHAALGLADAPLLDDPAKCVRFGFDLHEHTRAMGGCIGVRAHRLRARLKARTATALWLDEQVHGFAEGMLRMRQLVRAEIDRVPAARASTREELYRRLHVARDYMEATLADEVALRDIARAASMAPHHFLRSFRAVFHETPVRFLNRRRLERAKDLLRATDLPVGEVCLAVGFLNPSAFSRAFRREFGMAPLEMRGRGGEETEMEIEDEEPDCPPAGLD
jgi:AraC family transcriptional regulator